jgi:hypothetical protein
MPYHLLYFASLQTDDKMLCAFAWFEKIVDQVLIVAWLLFIT